MGISFISPESVNHLLHIFLHKYIDSLPFNVNQGQGDLQDGEYLQHFREPWHELNQVVVCQLSEHLGGSQIRSFNLVFIMLEQFVIYFQNINVKYGELGNCFKRFIFYHNLKDHILARFASFKVLVSSDSDFSILLAGFDEYGSVKCEDIFLPLRFVTL